MLSHQIWGGHGSCKPTSTKSLQIYVMSAAVFAKDRYSASVEDHATVGCFLALKLMSELPKNIQKPLVDLLSM
ncbi:hypothetical protein C1H46_025760 [Malus baccata]|uniref:Uncharacterized protein n=1 Tax=Malus baccata TaxID=106549 RepID=A0A540LQC2_MALBA|nr:hypothetical protein C1H46_025760 [Malus baccata]